MIKKQKMQAYEYNEFIRFGLKNNDIESLPNYDKLCWKCLRKLVKDYDISPIQIHEEVTLLGIAFYNNWTLLTPLQHLFNRKHFYENKEK